MSAQISLRLRLAAHTRCILSTVQRAHTTLGN